MWGANNMHLLSWGGAQTEEIHLCLDDDNKESSGGWGESIDDILDRRRRERASTVQKMDVHSRYKPTSNIDPHRIRFPQLAIAINMARRL